LNFIADPSGSILWTTNANESARVELSTARALLGNVRPRDVWWQAPEKPIKRQEKTEKPIPWWAWLIALWLVLALIRKLLT